MKSKSSPRRRNPIADNLIEVQSGQHAVRGLRAGLIDLASRLAESAADATALLILVDPLITDQRLEEEWGTAERILRPELLGRLGVVILRKGRLKGFPRDPDPAMQAVVDRATKDKARPGGTRLPRMETFPEILKVLVNQWMAGRGPMTADWLAKVVGCNYRTVARAVDRLRPSIERHSDRRFELRQFPRDEWAGLVALSDRARITLRYVDTSGQPRLPQFLLARLEKMGRSDIGVGGTLGAAHYCPKIDLAGSQRLDLSVHCPKDAVDLAIVGRLDPALKRSDDPAMPATVVLHVVRRRESLFDVDKSGLRWADPAECLLDLHEVRLESQARQLVEFFEARRLES